ncbi:MAG: hypothetical protein JXX28_11000 [Deltaproteobacteria bacterium]|nr:hypothetical protein [Deltaproteobacteria bacterium]
MLLLLSLLTTASAQERLQLDPVYVSLFTHVGEVTVEQADALRVAVEGVIHRDFIALHRAEVPPYEDYDAEVYLASCTDAQRTGCAYVIGDRAQAAWVISGMVFSPLGEDLQVEVAFLDVRNTRIPLVVQLPGDDPEFMAERITELMALVIQSPGVELDIREEDPALVRARRKEFAKAMSAELNTLEEELGGPGDREVLRAEQRQLTMNDLVRDQGREDGAPWEVVGMTQEAYLRYRNSGLSLLDWRARLRGREGRPVIGLGVGLGAGPWGERLDARWVLDENLQHLGTAAFLELRNTSSPSVQVEGGIGLTPNLQLSLAFASRTSQVSWIVHNEVEGQMEAAAVADEALRTTWQIGARADYIPLQWRSVRPTAGVGVAMWHGSRFDLDTTSSSFLPVFTTPSLLVIQGGPGVEAQLSEALLLFSRAEVLLGIGDGLQQVKEDGSAALYHQAEPEGWSPLGWQVSLGLQVLLPPLFGAHEPPKAMEDEPDF